MKQPFIGMALALAALLVGACTNGGQQSQGAAAAGKTAATSTASAGTSGSDTSGGGTSDSDTSGSGAPGSGLASGAADGCVGQPPVSPLPVWARAGFTPPDTAMPHVLGASGNIVAVLWRTKNALRVPDRPNPSNKILWVSRIPPLQAPSDLIIKATLAGTPLTVSRTVAGGPGPSDISLPAAGCWTFHLSWSGHTDVLKLRYTS